MKKIAFGCDHVGFILKEDILAHLAAKGIEVIDKGTWSGERTDYPRYASAVAEAVVAGEVEGRYSDLWHRCGYLYYGQQVSRYPCRGL